jgi:transcriptional regulator with XRE-family HTH domain
MDDFLDLNIKYLRKKKGLTQDQLADKIGVNRAMIGSYEEGRAVPKLSAIRTLAHYFSESIDSLINIDLSAIKSPNGDDPKVDKSGKGLRVLTTLVDRDNKEFITLVPVKASAGYLKGYSDPDFIETLPKFNLPFPELNKERTYRAFQVHGNSMEPLPSGSYIICEYIQNWDEIKEGKTYVLITHDDGVVFKRLYHSDKNMLLLKSDNPEYGPYTLPVNTISEVWKALGYISFSLPAPDEMHLGKLSAMVYKMQDELDKLKNEKKPGK